MAAANPLEDEISCSVCLEVYDDPHILRQCFHTFCLKCINKLEERGRVQCPECREFTNSRDVKKDFKMIRLIDLHNTQQAQVVAGIQPRTQICGMCKEPNTPVRSYCEECKYFICLGCVNGHKKFKALKYHKLKPVTVMIGQYESSLNKTINELKSEVKNIDRELSNVSINIKEVQQSNIRNIVDLKTFTKDRIKALEDNEQKLEKLINNANDNLVKHLNEKREMLNKLKKEIHTKIDLLEDLIKNQNVTALHETANNLNQTIQDDIRKIKVSLFQNSGDMSSRVTVQKGINWDVTKSIEVKVGDVMWDNQQIQPVLKPLYSELYSYKYQINKKVMLDKFMYKLCLNNNQLWCAGQDSLYMYDENCELVKQVKHDKISRPVSMTTSQTGNITVACRNYGGLHQLHTTGVYHSQIAEGSFSDVVCYNGDIYALEYKHCKVVVFRYNKTRDIWREVFQYKLQQSNGSEWDRLCVHTTGIHVSSFNDNCIYVYNLQGQFQHKIGEKGDVKPSELNGPFLCDIDTFGNLLVADYHNNRLQVCDSVGNWHVITLPDEVKDPVHALVGGHDDIWVIQDGPPIALMKYTKY